MSYTMTRYGLTTYCLWMILIKLYGKNEREIELLVQTVRIYSEDIAIEFGIQKCACIILKRGKTTSFDGINLPAEEGEISTLEQGEGFKYLGVLEELKTKLTKEYFHRTRLILKSRLNRGYVVAAINESAVSHLRYSAGGVEESGGGNY